MTIMFRLCCGYVSIMSRLCPDYVLVMSRLCLDYVSFSIIMVMTMSCKAFSNINSKIIKQDKTEVRGKGVP